MDAAFRPPLSWEAEASRRLSRRLRDDRDEPKMVERIRIIQSRMRREYEEVSNYLPQHADAYGRKACRNGMPGQVSVKKNVGVLGRYFGSLGYVGSLLCRVVSGRIHGIAATSPPDRLASDCRSVPEMPSATDRTPPSPDSTWNTPPGSRDRGLSEVSSGEAPTPAPRPV